MQVSKFFILLKIMTVLKDIFSPNYTFERKQSVLNFSRFSCIIHNWKNAGGWLHNSNDGFIPGGRKKKTSVFKNWFKNTLFLIINILSTYKKIQHFHPFRTKSTYFFFFFFIYLSWANSVLSRNVVLFSINCWTISYKKRSKQISWNFISMEMITSEVSYPRMYPKVWFSSPFST